MIYPVGAPRYEFRGGELARVQAYYDDTTGETTDDVQPADESVLASDQAGATSGSGPDISGDVYTGENRPLLGAPFDLSGPTPPSFPASQAGRLGDLTGNVGQYGQIPQSIADRMNNQYGMGVPQSSASPYGAGGTSMPPNSLDPNQQRQDYGQPQAQSQPGTPPNTQVDANGKPIADYMRGLMMYDPTNPVTAMENVIQDMGLGRGFGNPFVQFVKRMANGLALSYIAQNAQGGATAESMANAPYAFGEFLKNAIGGAGANSGMGMGMAQMINTASKLPQLVETVRGLNQSNQTGLNVNPFTEMLAEALDANFGQGTTGFLSNLLGPAMPRSLAQGYESGLAARLRNAQRAKLGIPATGGPTQGAPLGEGGIVALAMR